MSTCIVSAYYDIPSKKNFSFYESHIERFFRLITQDCIFYTDSQTLLKIMPIYNKYNRSNIQIVTLDFDMLPGPKPYSFWEKQCIIDVEKYHTPQLAKIWYNKSYLVKKTLESTNYDNYIWCDAGCIRNDLWNTSVYNFGKRNYILDDKVYIQLLNTIPIDKQYFQYPDVYVAGAIIAAKRNLWNTLVEKYEEMLVEYENKQLSCNMDQYILASCLIKYPQLFKPILYDNTISCPDSWFFFLSIL